MALVCERIGKGWRGGGGGASRERGREREILGERNGKLGARLVRLGLVVRKLLRQTRMERAGAAVGDYHRQRARHGSPGARYAHAHTMHGWKRAEEVAVRGLAVSTTHGSPGARHDTHARTHARRSPDGFLPRHTRDRRRNSWFRLLKHPLRPNQPHLNCLAQTPLYDRIEENKEERKEKKT